MLCYGAGGAGWQVPLGVWNDHRLLTFAQLNVGSSVVDLGIALLDQFFDDLLTVSLDHVYTDTHNAELMQGACVVFYTKYPSFW